MAPLYQLKRSVSEMIVVLISYLFLSVVVFSLTGCSVNNIPAYEEAVDTAWSQVINQYKRRTDLIPKLVNTVKDFAKKEKEVLKQVVEARNKANRFKLPGNILTNSEAFKKFQKSQDRISSALSRLMVVAENYPELKSDQNFMALKSQLEGIEGRISVARRDYIEAVEKYNTELRTIPGRWWKSLMYKDSVPRENFTTSESIDSRQKSGSDDLKEKG